MINKSILVLVGLKTEGCYWSFYHEVGGAERGARPTAAAKPADGGYDNRGNKKATERGVCMTAEAIKSGEKEGMTAEVLINGGRRI